MHPINRITPEMVEAAIVDESYTVLPNGKTTVCQLTLYNGFSVEGSSACVVKENFNAEIGNRIARENAVEQIWPLLGFRLAERLSRPALTTEDAAADANGTERPHFIDTTPALLRW